MSSLHSDLLAAPAIIRPRVRPLTVEPGSSLDNNGRIRQFTTDEFMTFDGVDQMTVDSTGAFLIGELERLDPTLHDPLVAVTWGRDIDLREDVSIADEQSSFTNSAFAAPGGISPTGKAWVSKDANAIAGIALDIGKTVRPLYLWGMEVKWTLPELASAAQLGRPVDVQKYDGMRLKHQMDIDEMVYIGDTDLGETGLVNSSAVTAANVVPGGTGFTQWSTKTPDEKLADVNTLLNSTWIASGLALAPDELRLPPVQFSQLVSEKVSTAGNISTLEFLKNNSLSNAINGRPLRILPLKWLTGRGAANSDRMMCYTKDRNRVRYPLVPLQRTPLEYRSLFQLTTYYGRLGVIEIVYSETLQYADGI